MVSEAKKKANVKWNKANYDKITLNLPKGIKAIIEQNSNSINSFCAPLIMAELSRLGLIDKPKE